MSYRLPDELYEYRAGATPLGVVGVEVDEKEPFPFIEGSGLMTKYKGWKYPRPQVADPYALRASDSVKKYIKSSFRMIFKPSLATWLEGFAEFAHNETVEFHMIPKVRPRMVQELLRVGEQLAIDPRITKSLGIIFEQDLNYRFPFQDIISELNKVDLMRNPAREVKRLILLLDARWHHGERGFKKLAYLSWVVLLLLPSARNFVKQFVRELDISKMQLSVYDHYSGLLEPKYDLMGLSYPDRQKAFLIL